MTERVYYNLQPDHIERHSNCKYQYALYHYDDSPKIGYIADVIVQIPYRRLGYGYSLMRDAISCAKNTYTVLRLKCNGPKWLHKFYINLGFKQMPRHTGWYEIDLNLNSKTLIPVRRVQHQIRHIITHRLPNHRISFSSDPEASDIISVDVYSVKRYEKNYVRKIVWSIIDEIVPDDYNIAFVPAIHTFNFRRVPGTPGETKKTKNSKLD